MPIKVPTKLKQIAALILCMVVGIIAVTGSIQAPPFFSNRSGASAALQRPTEPAGDWYGIFEHPFPANYWAEGVHSFSYSADCPVEINTHTENGPAYAFSVDRTAAVQDSTVFIRMRGLYLVAIKGDAFGHTLHPSQKTTAIYTLFAGSFADANRLQNECKISMQFDSGLTVELSPLDINQFQHRKVGKKMLHG